MDVAEVFEDVRVSNLERILDTISNQWITFSTRGDAEEGGWLLTFDDGNVSDYEIVHPRLIERGQRAVFFLIVDRIGSSGYLDWKQVKAMHDHGMEFGSHGLSHRNMCALPEKEARRELAHSRARIEDALGAPIRAFSFPYGAYSRRLIRMARQEGFEVLCTSDHGLCLPPFSLVPRNSIHGGMDGSQIEKVLEADRSLRLRWRVEDMVKKTARRCLGDERYMRLRRVLVGR